jgi:hypothetical protein
MEESAVQQEFERIEKYLFDSSNWQNMTLTRAWAKSQPVEAGVYMLFENGKPVYVGESGSISGRITDMLDSRHHTVRRSLGEKRFSNVPGFVKATSKRKHPVHIENLIHETLSSFKICVLPIKIGRKEFEEYIFPKYAPELNRKSKRGSRNV